MSFETRFRAARAARYQEWLYAARAWALGDAGIFARLGPAMILVHSSDGSPERFLLPRLSQVQTFGGFPKQGGGAAVGAYKGVPIWIVHQPVGCTASQFFLECLAGSPVRYLIGLAEMTGYQEWVHIGDLVLPTVAVRGDLVTDYHAPPEVPAAADPALASALQDLLSRSGHRMHTGPIYSGRPGGVGIHNPILEALTWRHLEQGLLGNASEASTTLLEAWRCGIRAAEVWAVSDDLYQGLMVEGSEERARWATAWELMAQAALEVLWQASTGTLL